MFVNPVSAGSVTLDPGAKHAPGAPVICSEFGGVNIKPPKDVVASDRDWGYTTASNAADFLVRLEKLVMGIVKGGFTCGLVYTQLYVVFSSPLFRLSPAYMTHDSAQVGGSLTSLDAMSSKKSTGCMPTTAARRFPQPTSKPLWTQPRITTSSMWPRHQSLDE